MRVCIGFQGGVWNRLKIQENSEKFRKIQKNSEKFGKIRKNSEKFGKIRKNSGKLGKIRKNGGIKHKKIGKFSFRASRDAQGGVHKYPKYPQLTARGGCSQKFFSGGGVVLFFLPREGYKRSYSKLKSRMLMLQIAN